MARIIREFIAPAVTVLLAAAAAGPAAAEEAGGTAGQPMIGTPAPAFELETTAGDTLSLAGLRGNFLVVHFGASW